MNVLVCWNLSIRTKNFITLITHQPIRGRATNNDHTREQPLFALTKSTKYTTAPSIGTEKTQYWKEPPVLAAVLPGLEYLIKFKGGSKQRGVP